MSEVFSAFCSAGLWPGLESALAARLPDAGIEGPERVTVGRLAGIDGIGRERAQRLVANFEKARRVYEVAELLVPAGAPAGLAAGAVRYIGDAAAVELREDPWRLLTIPGVRPDQADHLARRLLGAEATPADVRRGRALVVHVLTRAARDGHTALGASTVASAVGGFGAVEPREAVEAALDDAQVMAFGHTSERDGPDASGSALLALARYALAEEAVAEGVTRLAATSEPLCADDEVAAVTDGLDAAQRCAVARVAAAGVSVLTGGPGTGKSRTVAAVAELARRLGLDIALAAPTGRAAKRLEEITHTSATTLHRLLGAQSTTGEFTRGVEWPLDEQILVVDEASMLDVELAAALVEACADGSHLLFVGDPGQLPPIGPGRVLTDVISSDTVPVTELRNLYRQREGGTIARLATAVREGGLPSIESPEREVVVVPSRGGSDAAHRVTQLVTDSIPRALGIPAEHTQVVTPVHRGQAGTVALNRELKAKLNPGRGEHHGFDVGDRVVAVANHIDHGFANGEVGTVNGAEDGGLVVEFASGPMTVPTALLGDLRHGWAITVHRAQGSEWPAVVAVLPGEAAGMLSRPLVYTAFTRAQRHLSVVHAAGPALIKTVRQGGVRPRHTRLAAILREDG